MRDEKGHYFFLLAKHDPNGLRVGVVVGEEIVGTVTDMAGIALGFLDVGIDGFVKEL